MISESGFALKHRASTALLSWDKGPQERQRHSKFSLCHTPSRAFISELEFWVLAEVLLPMMTSKWSLSERNTRISGGFEKNSQLKKDQACSSRLSCSFGKAGRCQRQQLLSRFFFSFLLLGQSSNYLNYFNLCYFTCKIFLW